VVLWETLTGRKLFDGDTEAAIVGRMLEAPILPPSRFSADVPSALDGVVLRGLARNPKKRFESAQGMAAALEGALRPALASEVPAWLQGVSGPRLTARAGWVRSIESASPHAPGMKGVGSVESPPEPSPPPPATLPAPDGRPRRARAVALAILSASVLSATL